MKLSLLLLALPLAAQTFTVDAGSPSDTNCTGARWTAANDPAMGRQQAPYNTLRYAASFSCDVPVPVGSCSPTLLLFENRPAVATATVPAAGPGLRVFTVSSATTSTVIDIFLMAGAQTPFQLALPSIPTPDGHLRLTFTASKGNASLSGLSITCTPAPVPPFTFDPVTKSWTWRGDLRIEGNVAITGVEDIGTSGVPTTFTITQSDGSTCRITFQSQALRWSCP